MRMNSGNTLVLIYNSFKDPLFQNLVLQYVKRLSPKTESHFHLITFEQSNYAMSQEEIDEAKRKLLPYNIHWHPLVFHTGRLLILKKAYDFTQALIKVVRLKFSYNLKVIFCFANVSASIGVALSRLLNMKMIIYSYEPHSNFLMELGIWKKNSLKYKILSFLENKAGTVADFVMTGTKHMVEDLNRRGVKGNAFRAPTAVDPAFFTHSQEGRLRVRKEINISDDQFVVIYVGKFGDLYYHHEIPLFFSRLKESFPNMFFLVVTSNDHTEVKEMFQKKLEDKFFYITGNLSYNDLKDHLSAADIGISGVPPSPSQKYRSPTKVAEYLLMGLPYITTKGVAEDDEVALKNKVGMVVENFIRKPNDDQLEVLGQLISEKKNDLRLRCRKVGLEYRSMDRIDNILENIYADMSKGNSSTDSSVKGN